MGRKAKLNGVMEEKKSPIKIKPIPRKHAGKITAPWALMERLISEVPAFAHLKVAKIKLWWQKDWKADIDGIAIGAQVCKASEVDRNLAEESNGETVDLFIKLPEAVWPTLDETEKEHRMFHELCHIMAAKNANGDQKRDSKDRLLWRLRKHPITAFHEEIDRFGMDRVIGHNEAILESVETADRPMEKLFDEAEKKATGKHGKSTKNSDESWRQNSLAAAGFTEKQIDAMEAASIHTLGELQDAMTRHGEWWAKNTGVSGRLRQKIEDVFNAYITEVAQQADAAKAA